jgi:hypothetical protein
MKRHQALLNNVEGLRQQLHNHWQLLQQDEQSPQGGELGFCPNLQCPHEQVLRDALRDVIEVLEETRQSFKSKRLEQLRKRMIKTLCSSLG